MIRYETVDERSETYRRDNLFIPKDEGNRHYREMQALIEAGEAEIVPYESS